MTGPPVLHLLLNKSIPVVPAGKLNRRLAGQKGLNQNPPSFFASSGPSGRLTNQLERPLIRPKIRQRKRRVRTDNPHQRYVGKVQPLGQHLRARQNINAPLRKILQQPVIVFARHCIAVNPPQTRLRQFVFHFFFQTLRAQPNHRHSLPAQRTGLGYQRL